MKGKLSVALLIVIVVSAVVDYLRFRRQVEGNFFTGWVVSRYVKLTKDLDTFAVDSASLSTLGGPAFLSTTLPIRSGARPQMIRGMPHRQITQKTDANFQAIVEGAIFSSDQFRDSPLPIAKDSLWEFTGARAFVIENCPSGTCREETIRAKGEFIHRHRLDGSFHVVLSPTDAATVVQKGWAERFPLAGILRGKVPVGIVLVYAPRDKSELEILKTILQAAYRFATSAQVGTNGAVRAK